MSKLAIAGLTVAAFAYAVWLVVLRRRLPDPQHVTGWRRRFVLATLLFVGLLAPACDKGKEAQPVCYVTFPPSPPTASRGSASTRTALATLQAVWRTLDRQRGEEFRKKLEAAVARGELQKNAAEMLATAFDELAYHKELTRGRGPGPTCYTMPAFGSVRIESTEEALKQVELLAKARQSGTIDSETAAKACAALSRELEMLDRAKAQASAGDWEDERHLVEQYEAGHIVPGDAASQAAALIVKMESGPCPSSPSRPGDSP